MAFLAVFAVLAWASTFVTAIESTDQVSASRTTINSNFTAVEARSGDNLNLAPDTYANLPAATTAGRVFWATDSPYQFRDNGSTWDAFLPQFGQVTLPPTAGWTDVNLGSATYTADSGWLGLKTEGVGSSQVRIKVRTIPATPYTVTACLVITSNTGSSSAGLFLRESGTGRIVTLSIGGTGTLNSAKYTNETTFSATYSSNSGVVTPQGSKPCFRRADNGTTRTLSFSNDREQWVELPTQGHTDFLTADQIGWGMVTGSGSSNGEWIAASLLSWDEE